MMSAVVGIRDIYAHKEKEVEVVESVYASDGCILHTKMRCDGRHMPQVLLSMDK